MYTPSILHPCCYIIDHYNVLSDPEVISRLKSATPTRITVTGKDLATPKDLETYKDSYENVALVGSGTFGSVYYAR